MEDHFDPEFPKSEVIPVVLKRRNVRKASNYFAGGVS
jgi:hypothetical protein